MTENNFVSVELVTMLTMYILSDRKEILPAVFQNEDVTKEVLMIWMHVEPKSVSTLNETTF